MLVGARRRGRRADASRRARRRRRAPPRRRCFVAAGAGRLYLAAEAARDGRASCRGSSACSTRPSLFSIAYGEIASSLYFALGVVALYALGFTPLRCCSAPASSSFIVSLSYAEGTTAIRETGGAATFVRKAFNDLAGFVTGWVLFLDYLIVIALVGALRPALPRRRVRLGTRCARARGTRSSRSRVDRRDRGVRLLRRPQLYLLAVGVAVVDLATQLLLVGLGLRAPVLAATRSTAGVELGVAPTWDEIAFALPLALLAYTGLETVANLAEETREPGPHAAAQPLRRRSALVVAVYVAIALVGLSAFPAAEGRPRSASEWRARAARWGSSTRSAPSSRLARRRRSRLRRPHRRADPARGGDDLDLRLRRGSRTRSASTASCRARSGASTAGRSSRRRRSWRGRRRGARCSWSRRGRATTSVILASLYSFGVLLAFTRRAARRDPAAVHAAGAARGRSACPATCGSAAASVARRVVLTGAIFVMVVALGTHPGARSRARSGCRRLRPVRARAPSTARGCVERARRERASPTASRHGGGYDGSSCR